METQIFQMPEVIANAVLELPSVFNSCPSLQNVTFPEIDESQQNRVISFSKMTWEQIVYCKEHDLVFELPSHVAKTLNMICFMPRFVQWITLNLSN